MTQKSVRANYIYNAAYQVLNLLTPLITTPYISRVLKADSIGIYSFVYSVMSYFALFAGMGIFTYGQREVSYFQDNRKERSRVFWELKCLSLITTLTAMTAYVIMSLICAGDDLAVYISVGITILYTATDTTWLFMGMEDFGKIVSVGFVIKILDIVFTFIFIKHKSDLVLHISAMVFFILSGSIWLWRYVPEYIDRPDFKNMNPFRNIKVIWSMFVPTIAVHIYSMLDKTMIGLLTEGSYENGYYELAARISRMSLMLVTSIGSVMIPRIGYLFGQNDKYRINLYMQRSYNFVWFLGIPLCLGLIGISDNFVPWFFGEGFDKVSGLLKISGFLIPAIGISTVTGAQYLIPTKRQNMFTLTVITGACVNIILNAVLIIHFKSYGAVIASVIAEIVILLHQLYIVRDELNFKEIMFSSGNYIISGIIMLIVLRFINANIMPSVINTFIMIFSGACIYFIGLYVMRDKFFIDYSLITYDSIKRRLNIISDDSTD